MGDRLFLEIVTEREIAQHFEEGVVTRGITDIVEVVMLSTCAHALLARHRRRIRPRLQAGEDVLERHHARVDEHQGRVVVRDQWCRWHHTVACTPEIFKKRAANVVGRCHGLDLGEGRTLLKRAWRQAPYCCTSAAPPVIPLSTESESGLGTSRLLTSFFIANATSAGASALAPLSAEIGK